MEDTEEINSDGKNDNKIFKTFSSLVNLNVLLMLFLIKRNFKNFSS